MKKFDVKKCLESIKNEYGIVPGVKRRVTFACSNNPECKQMAKRIAELEARLEKYEPTGCGNCHGPDCEGSKEHLKEKK